MCITNNHASFHLWLKENLIKHQKVSKYYDVDYKNLKNFVAPFFYGWCSAATRLEPLRGGSLLFTPKFPEIPGTHFIDLGRLKG